MATFQKTDKGTPIPASQIHSAEETLSANSIVFSGSKSVSGASSNGIAP